jgi:hypothetical protein
MLIISSKLNTGNLTPFYLLLLLKFSSIYILPHLCTNLQVLMFILYVLKFCCKMHIRVITKLLNSEQSYKGKVKTHKYINRQNLSQQPENCENRNDLRSLFVLLYFFFWQIMLSVLLIFTGSVSPFVIFILFFISI